jgi:hypothetical protein
MRKTVLTNSEDSLNQLSGEGQPLNAGVPVTHKTAQHVGPQRLDGSLHICRQWLKRKKEDKSINYTHTHKINK